MQKKIAKWKAADLRECKKGQGRHLEKRARLWTRAGVGKRGWLSALLASLWDLHPPAGASSSPLGDLQSARLESLAYANSEFLK